MSALRLSDFSPILANHRVMGVYGMVAGWLATQQPSLLALCTTRPAGLVPALSVHVREHVAMFIGMALGTLVSIAVASRAQRTQTRWANEASRGMRCFLLMSFGMVLGTLAIGDLQLALPGGLLLPAMSSAMLAGMVLGVLAEQICERGFLLARTYQERRTARLVMREHAT
jgi:hypothetical protein